jgi:predicted anti-sigma-YlaC factor YlaD
MSLANMLLKALPPCKEVTEMISRELDVGLSLLDRIKVRLHLMTCRWCRRYLKQIDFIHETLHEHGRTPGESAPPDVLRRLKEAVRMKT